MGKKEAVAMDANTLSIIDVILGQSPASAARGLIYGIVIMCLAQWRGWIILGPAAQVKADNAGLTAKVSAMQEKITALETKAEQIDKLEQEHIECREENAELRTELRMVKKHLGID